MTPQQAIERIESALAGDVNEASKLLQHSSIGLTKKHYRTKPEKLTAVRWFQIYAINCILD